MRDVGTYLLKRELLMTMPLQSAIKCVRKIWSGIGKSTIQVKQHQADHSTVKGRRFSHLCCS